MVIWETQAPLKADKLQKVLDIGTGTGSIEDWPALFKQAHNVLKPGAWLESYDGTPVLETDDDTLGENMAKWGTFFVEGGKKIGRSFTVLEDGTQRKAMEEAGFVDIQERDFKVPLGRWPKDKKLKEIGTFGHLTVMSDTEGVVLFMANVLGWSAEESQV
ncbi:hypothetical protein UCRPA7_3323 [Phaeoacremonium minimum UCRPA7]|uniref:Uncharacterized protein n=1 Tax=Phaeoacremonium minimum (strain UCR-PA7) TaxID=1286976 RepID=R8BP71_PHAM7|nr:hypothetical protein UCRPA7_3323 [Phaeoacremonium minimum UCRPA7]EOO01090.1 hypothetical protein UCRPA7_3323 [Phaeoacremonium minimum UCRPA7]